MRQKYIDEKWPDLMVFGKFEDGDVCVTDSDDNLNAKMEPSEAEIMVEHYNKLKEEFSAMAMAFNEADPKAFDQFWYGERK